MNKDELILKSLKSILSLLVINHMKLFGIPDGYTTGNLSQANEIISDIDRYLAPYTVIVKERGE
uniref:Uncharacterized protein n=1 Tax=viral metagenome TaxID=1070528 RepID=A0A6H1Z9R8_9ZZZZ